MSITKKHNSISKKLFFPLLILANLISWGPLAVFLIIGVIKDPGVLLPYSGVGQIIMFIVLGFMVFILAVVNLIIIFILGIVFYSSSVVGRATINVLLG